MPRSTPDRFSSLAALVPFCLLAAACQSYGAGGAGGAARAEPAGTEGEASTTTSETSGVSDSKEPQADEAERQPESAEEEPWGPQPPDGEWLEDDDGRRYFLREVPRIEGAYDWVNEERTRIRVQYGLEFDVAEYDEQTLVLKVYEAKRPEFANADTRSERTPADGEPPRPEETIAPGPTHEVEFRPFSEGLPRAGQWRHGFELADMDGDGRLDLVHGPPRKGNGRPAIFLGAGDGTWTRWEDARFPREAYDYGDVAVADFNRDGNLDVALAMHMRGIRILVGDGAGTFTPWSEGVQYDGGKAGDEPAFSSRAAAAVDWNGDGWPDLVALGEGFRGASFQAAPNAEGETDPLGSTSMGFRVFLNQGDGTWRETASPDVDRSLGDALATGEFNDDGQPDVVTASMTRGWRGVVYLGDGDGGWTHRALDALPARAFVHAVAVADLDGDGVDEVVVAYTRVEASTWTSGVDVFDPGASGESGPDWQRHPLLEIENDRFVVTALGAGEVDGDGIQDVVALTSRGEVRLFLGTGGLRFLEEEAAAELRPPQSGCQGQTVAVRDLNGDGAGEIVAAFAGEATGMAGMHRKQGCAQEGSLEAWSPAPVSGAARSGS
ncbi:MAG: FG-GAP repeat domain-containing protein [bacterium]